jgi:hypothetical protein
MTSVIWRDVKARCQGETGRGSWVVNVGAALRGSAGLIVSGEHARRDLVRLTIKVFCCGGAGRKVGVGHGSCSIGVARQHRRPASYCSCWHTQPSREQSSHVAVPWKCTIYAVR